MGNQAGPVRYSNLIVPIARSAFILLILSAIPRIYFAHVLALNPDEAWHTGAALTADFYQVFHPPLPFHLIGALASLSLSEFLLRSASVLAGSLTAPLLYLFLRRHFPPHAAFLPALLFALSPNLILLSIQLRGYPFAIFAAALALYTFDGIFHSTRDALLHAVALALGLLSEFCFAFPALAFGLTGIVTILHRRPPRAAILRWSLVQSVGLAAALYLYLFFVLPIWRVFSGRSADFHYISDGFPGPTANLAWFSFIALAKQFQYLSTSLRAGLLLFLVAAAGMYLLARSRNLQLLLPTAFAIAAALAAALWHVFPLGISRHQSPLIILLLVPVAAALARIALRPALFLSAVAAAVMFFAPTPDRFNPPLHAWRKSFLLPALEQLRLTLPPGSTLITDEESRLLLRHYWAGPASPVAAHSHFRPASIGGRQIHIADFSWEYTRHNRHKFLARIHPLASQARPFYFLDTGFSAINLEREGIGVPMQILTHTPGALFLSVSIPQTLTPSPPASAPPPASPNPPAPLPAPANPTVPPASPRVTSPSTPSRSHTRFDTDPAPASR